jgi:hypothetical protein
VERLTGHDDATEGGKRFRGIQGIREGAERRGGHAEDRDRLPSRPGRQRTEAPDLQGIGAQRRPFEQRPENDQGLGAQRIGAQPRQAILRCETEVIGEHGRVIQYPFVGVDDCLGDSGAARREEEVTGISGPHGDLQILFRACPETLLDRNQGDG